MSSAGAAEKEPQKKKKAKKYASKSNKMPGEKLKPNIDKPSEQKKDSKAAPTTPENSSTPPDKTMSPPDTDSKAEAWSKAFADNPAIVEPSIIIVHVPCKGTNKDCVNVVIKNKCTDRLAFKVEKAKNWRLAPYFGFVEPMSKYVVDCQPKPIKKLEDKLDNISITIAPTPSGESDAAKVWQGNGPKQTQRYQVPTVLREPPTKKPKKKPPPAKTADTKPVQTATEDVKESAEKAKNKSLSSDSESSDDEDSEDDDAYLDFGTIKETKGDIINGLKQAVEGAEALDAKDVVQPSKHKERDFVSQTAFVSVQLAKGTAVGLGRAIQYAGYALRMGGAVITAAGMSIEQAVSDDDDVVSQDNVGKFRVPEIDEDSGSSSSSSTTDSSTQTSESEEDESSEDEEKSDSEDEEEGEEEEEDATTELYKKSLNYM